ncbi:MAG: DUF2283 domain-containing protein [Chloroflexi bacterium]|nr:DUF2283 domain-containing protein [Chloroflexota bacterium]
MIAIFILFFILVGSFGAIVESEEVQPGVILDFDAHGIGGRG